MAYRLPELADSLLIYSQIERSEISHFENDENVKSEKEIRISNKSKHSPAENDLTPSHEQFMHFKIIAPTRRIILFFLARSMTGHHRLAGGLSSPPNSYFKHTILPLGWQAHQRPQNRQNPKFFKFQ